MALTSEYKRGQLRKTCLRGALARGNQSEPINQIFERLSSKLYQKHPLAQRALFCKLAYVFTSCNLAEPATPLRIRIADVRGRKVKLARGMGRRQRYTYIDTRRARGHLTPTAAHDNSRLSVEKLRSAENNAMRVFCTSTRLAFPQ